MRVLFVCYPSTAHLYPAVPYAWALRGAGHEVRVASFAGFAGAIAATGLTPVPLGDASGPESRLADGANGPAPAADVERFADALRLTGQDREHWYVFHQYLLLAASDYLRADRPEVGDLVDVATAWRPDLVVWEPTMPVGALAARLVGAAHVRLVAGLDFFAWARDRIDAAGLGEDPLAELVRPTADRYGLDVDRELLFGMRSVDPVHPGFGLPVRVQAIPVRWVPYCGSAPARPYLDGQPVRPRVGLTLGESTRRFMRGDWDRLPRLLDALAGLDVEVLATLNSVQLDGLDVPPNVRTFDWIPLDQLLPTCSALIHHGGMGTFAAACAFGVPQLVCDTEESNLIRLVGQEAGEPVPGTFSSGLEFGMTDAPAGRPRTRWSMPAKKLEATPCADLVTRYGAGARLNHRARSVARLREQIWQVVSEPAFRSGADALRTRWRAAPSPNEIVPVLEDVAAGRAVSARPAATPA